MIIKTGIKTGVLNELEIDLNQNISSKLNKFKSMWDKNGFLPSKDKFISNINSEIFASLYIEGEISSRRLIKNAGEAKDVSDMSINVKNFREAFLFIHGNNEISIGNIFTVYSILTKGINMGNNKLEDGNMFRHDNVFIGGNSMKGEYEGIDPKELKNAFNELIIFIKKDDIDPVIKGIVSHFYFEIMHPFFDFNGRTGRFIPMWIGLIESVDCLRYFVTSVGNFRESYLALFKDSIVMRTRHVNINRFISGILDLLLINQHQYKFITECDELMHEETGRFLNANQKNIIYYLMIKYEKQNKALSWSKFGHDALKYIEIDLKQPQFSREMKQLVDGDIIEKSSTNPVKYKLKGYKLYK